MQKLFIWLLLNLTTFYSHSKTIQVCPTCQFTNPEQAIKNAVNGDLILIASGTYQIKNLQVNKSIVLKGIDFPVLDGGKADECITITSPYVVLEGLTIINSKRGSMTDYAGIRLKNVHHITLRNNMLRNTFFGIYVANSTDILIEKNTLQGNATGDNQSGNGIHLWQCQRIHIQNNNISGHRDGIYFEFARFCEINNNLSEKNFRYGLHFMFSDNDTYTNNIFRNNGTGVAVMYTKGIYMSGNIFANNWGSSAYGLLLKDIGDSRILNNHFTNNTVGLYMEGSSRIELSANTFERNGWALKLLANCGQDSFKRNTFSGNTFDVSTNGTIYLNYFDGNYWDRYDGYDLNRDGIGDVPHRPVSLYAIIIEQMPYSIMLLRSFAVDLLDKAEKNIPSLIPDQLKDESPLMKNPNP